MGKKTILIVDDDESILNVIETLLKSEGYKVVKAENGVKALAKLTKTKVDLVLIDHFMPKMTGVELLEKIRADKKLKNLKCAFITVGIFKKFGKRWIEKLNALDYIHKPFDNKDLVKRVKKMLEQK